MNSDAASNPYMISQPTELWSVLRRICPGFRPKPPAFAQSNEIPEFHLPTAPSPLVIPVNQQRVSAPASQRAVLHTRVHTAPEQPPQGIPVDKQRGTPSVLQIKTYHYPYYSWVQKNLGRDRVNTFAVDNSFEYFPEGLRQRFEDFPEGLRPLFYGNDADFLQELNTYKKKIQVEIEQLEKLKHDDHDGQWIPWDQTSTMAPFCSLSDIQSEIKKTIAEIEELEEKLSKLRNVWNRDLDDKNNAKNIQEWEQWKYAHYAQGSTEEPHDKRPVKQQKAPQALPPGWESDNTVTWDKPVASETTQPSLRGTILATPVAKNLY
jgi:hypothetical protein